MSAYAFYFLGVVLVLFVVGFVAYYSYRLGSARKRLAEERTPDFEGFLRADGPVPQGSPRTPERERSATGVMGQSTRESALPDTDTLGSDEAFSLRAQSTTYERGPGLRTITDDSVFMRLDKNGELLFQIGEKPAMPLKYLLDASARSILQQLSRRATADYGQSWAILASEDEDGRLTITRLA